MKNMSCFKLNIALKKNSGKKTVFSLAQKEIMMLFYNRQATSGMRANPKDVIACMREREEWRYLRSNK